MIPVHVLVSGMAEDEQRYADAFGGAVDLYRFRTNVEAIERLSTAQTPVHVLIVTPNQESLFNATAAQLVERLAGPGFASTETLRGMQVVVVGEQVPALPRVHAVSTLDAAIRLVKFGEVEAAPMPPQVPQQVAMPTAAHAPMSSDPRAAHGAPASGLASSVISAIWDEAGRAAPAATPSIAQQQQALAQQAHAAQQQAQAQAAAQQQAMPAARVRVPRGLGSAVQGGGPARPSGPGGLFASEAAVGATQAPVEPGMAYPDGLEPVRHFEVPSRGAYQGDGRRAAVGGAAQSTPIIRARHSVPVPGAPAGNVPPALAQQVQQLVYPGVAASTDPLLGFSEPVQRQVAAMQASAPAEASAIQVMANAGMQAMPMQQHGGMGGYAPQPGMQQPHAVMGGGPAMPGAAPAKGRKRGRFARAAKQARQAERAPLMPNQASLRQHAMQPGAPMASPLAMQPMMSAHAPQPSAAMAAGGDPFVARAASAGDVSFG